MAYALGDLALEQILAESQVDHLAVAVAQACGQLIRWHAIFMVVEVAAVVGEEIWPVAPSSSSVRSGASRAVGVDGVGGGGVDYLFD